MRFKNRGYHFFYCYFCSFGPAALLFTICGSLDDIFYRFLLPTAVSLMVPAAMNVLLFYKPSKSSAQRWLDRATYANVAIISTLAVYSAFGIYNSWQFLLLATAVMVGIFAIFAVPLWYFADRREKRNLQAMNEKFSENIEE